ncbi:DUF4954 family protein, partial [Escherichia coli]|nr:DUF4954 family protein [Escherichia coli]
NGCHSRAWDKILVSEGFDPGYIINVVFEGEIRLGATGTEMVNRDGITKYSGIYDSELRDCEVGDNAYISRTDLVYNYLI